MTPLPRGGQISLASLIVLGDSFHLPQRLIRSSVGRLAKEGWIAATRKGRNSYYSLTGAGRRRFAQATQRIYAAQPPSWSGLWTLVVVLADTRQSRDKLREELRWLNFSQVAAGVFVHPLLEEDTVRTHLAPAIAGDLIIMRDARSALMPDSRLVELGWDFGDLARRYRQFLEMFSSLQEELLKAAVILPERAFVLRTLLLHEYRKIHLRDPLLPSVLLPPRWPGTDALELCRRIYARVFRASEQFLSETGETLSGPLPGVSSDIYLRFGGLPR